MRSASTLWRCTMAGAGSCIRSCSPATTPNAVSAWTISRAPAARKRSTITPRSDLYVVALHNGWRGFLYPFLLPGDHAERCFGMDDFSRSGSPKEIYHHAAFDPVGIREKILSAIGE